MKRKIIIIQTGGTISMELDPTTKRTRLGQLNTDALQAIQNQLSDITIEWIELANLPSPSMTIEKLFELSSVIQNYVNDPEISGVVVTHGTDTLDESSYFIDLKINTHKPIVFTGSMRNKSELGYDGVSNLYGACLVASNFQSENRGVLVVMNDEINSALEVTKTHTLSRDTFKSLEFGPLGVIDSDEVIYHRIQTRLNKGDTSSSFSRVEIVKCYLDSDSSIIDFLISQKVDGIILEALGRGNVPPKMIYGIKRAIDAGITLVITSRCVMGRVIDTYDYVGGGFHLKQLGVKFAGNLNSQKARLKLLLEGKNFFLAT